MVWGIASIKSHNRQWPNNAHGLSQKFIDKEFIIMLSRKNKAENKFIVNACIQNINNHVSTVLVTHICH